MCQEDGLPQEVRAALPVGSSPLGCNLPAVRLVLVCVSVFSLLCAASDQPVLCRSNAVTEPLESLRPRREGTLVCRE